MAPDSGPDEIAPIVKIVYEAGYTYGHHLRELTPNDIAEMLDEVIGPIHRMYDASVLNALVEAFKYGIERGLLQQR